VSLRSGCFAAVAALAVAASAHAGNESRACAETFEKAQIAKKDNRLQSAREQAVSCGRDACPAFVRDECVKMVSEIDAVQPSVIFDARDDKGNDVIDVHVDVDGVALTDRLGATAVPLDPGEHTLRFTRAGQAPIEQRLLIRTNEKNRVVHVAIPSSAAPVVVQPPTTARNHYIGGPIWPAILATVVGVGLVGGSIGLGVDAKGTADNLRATCAPRCSHSDVSAVNTELVVSDVLLGTGVVALGVATLLFITRPGGHEATARPAFTFSPSPNGAVAGVHLAF
jgi:hypothetical protein